ncbi:MAG TPA: glycosyl hydrolase family 28 protein, partial [Fimbriimonadaceae bacterium]|nr:glycosyl hydrolase family 28 protein [Fimbriimonadaceae bacterium]
GPLEAVVHCPRPVESCAVHPFRRGVNSRIDGSSVHLDLGIEEPRYLIVLIDDHPPLLLLVDPVERDAPNREAHNVLDLARVVADHHSVEERTAIIEEAFAKAAKDRRIAYVPPGLYEIGPIKIHRVDGLQIYFAPGSQLRTEPSPAGKNIHSHGLWLQDSQNVRIWGRGCLDHQGWPNFAHGRNDYNHGLISYAVTSTLCPFTTESPIYMLRCRNVAVEGFMIRNSRNMNLNVRRCDGVTLRRVKLVTPPASTPEYGDGFHVNSSTDYLIENCLAFCNDDCFASGHYTYFDDRDSGRHVIRGLVGWEPRANAVRLGYYTYYNQGEFIFENCDFAGMAASGIVIHPLNDAPEAHRFQRYGAVSFTSCGFDADRISDALVDVMGVRMASLVFDNVVFSDRKPIRIHGHGDGADGIPGLRLTGVTLAGKPLAPGDVDLQHTAN